MKYIILLVVFISNTAFSQLPKLKTHLELPPVDVAKSLSKTANTPKNKPLQYALPTEVSDVFVMNNKSKGGQWKQFKDGSWAWYFKVHSENAMTVEFGLYDFYMPPTASISFYDFTGTLVKGPFNDKKNKPHKQLWPGPIIGDTATIEVRVADKYKRYVSFSVKQITRGFRNIWGDVDLLPKKNQAKFWQSDEDLVSVKSGSCNVDVVCDEGNAWRDQIRSVAAVLVNGSDQCSGQMVNNTANNGKPYFTTAHHCQFRSANAASLGLIWNYQSSSCRVVGSSASGTPISKTNFHDTQSGSTFRATSDKYDATLLELDEVPKDSYDVFYSGWDRRDISPGPVVGIHHPSVDAKRISFENDQTTIISNVPVGTIPQSSNSHIRVIDWDIGTTERGSSGSGIWNNDGLLVGFLSGGAALCGNNGSDYYGRFSQAWEGGGTPSTRLKDWLDPINTGATTLHGFGGCPQFNINISNGSADQAVGVVQNFSATVSGGNAPYGYKWDINDDTQTDGTESSVNATYSQRYVGNVTLEITDADGCLGNTTKAVVIEAPKVNTLTVNNAVQMCGNGDGVIDPGERWKVPVTMQNNGFKTAQSAYAVLTKDTSSSTFELTADDAFGNIAGLCDKQFVDISTSGTDLVFTPVFTNFPALDDGVAAVTLPQAFSIYGKSYGSLYISTNGYISVDPADSGGAVENTCPIPSPNTNNNINNGGSDLTKIMPLHDDLIVEHVYYQHYAACPRQSVLATGLSCDVIMYTGVSMYTQDGPVGNFSFEAILYPTVNQWVYQYQGNDVALGAASVGMQSDNAADGINFSCNTNGEINTQQAVCIYHKDNKPQLSSDDTWLNLETPVLTLGDLPVSGQSNNDVEFSIAQNAPCGSPIKLDMQAVVYNTGFNQDDKQVLSSVLGNNGTCNVVSNCSPTSANDIAPVNGLWFNPNRSGNGNDMFKIGDKFFYTQYTTLENRSPIWYQSDFADLQNNQVKNELKKFTYSGSLSPFNGANVSSSVIGQSLTTLIDSNNAVQTRTINGEFSADLLTSFIFSSDAPTQQETGLWFNSSESGWGQTIGTQGDTEVIINYLYDDNGQPYWVLGAGANLAVEDIDLKYFNSFCPHCPSVDVTSSVVGNVRINYSSSSAATMENMQINVSKSEHPSTWSKSNLPLSNLTPQE